MKDVKDSSIKYRDPDLERAVVALLRDAEQRTEFLRAREGYVGELSLPNAAKSILLSISDEMINDAARRFNDSSAPRAQTPIDPATDPCELLTLPWNNCDG